MSDPAIKLFGKSIALPSHSYQAGGGAGGEGGGGGSAGEDEDKGFTNNEKIPTQTIDKEQVSANSEDKSDEPITTAASTANHESHQQKPPPSAVYNDDDDDEQEKEEEEQQQQSDAQDQKPALKKPDKILPCPRCNSLDTKFCYYNNYNVNQPRHFCKNCQRYWTAGGTMRNVPVGAGRRKNKNAAAVHYRHLTLTDATALQAITPDAVHHPALKPNGTVLSFGSDTPLCESMASVLSLADKTMKNCSRHRFQRIDEQSTGSSALSSNSAADHEGNGANVQEPAGTRNCQGFAPPPPPPYINGSSPWPYLWSLTPLPTPGTAPFCGSSFPIPIYPAMGYWGCNAWSVPWVAPVQDSPSPTSTSPGSGSNSPTLGKHTREGNVLHKGSAAAAAAAADGVNKQNNQDKCLWVPKTLRIDDPEEAAKSSIWVTMGFDKADGMSSRAGGGLFKSFQTKAEVGSHKLEASQALHANPAALSRSISFHESS